MAEIVFLPYQQSVEPDGKRSLLQLARDAGIAIQAPCGGKKICGKCKIVIEKAESFLAPPSAKEKESLGDLTDKGYRLACETVLDRDATVRIPEESLTSRQVILTSEAKHPYPVRLRPPVDHYYVEVPPATLDPVIADRERLESALQKTYGIRKPILDVFALRKLPHALRSGNKGVTAAIRYKREVIDFLPKREGGIFGMAFDVGTTTLVGYLLDLKTGKKLSVKSALNPQIAYGADVISRIALCQEREDGLQALRSSVIDCLNELIQQASTEAGVNPKQIMEITAVGNTVMSHLLVGLDPRYVARAPYVPVVQSAEDMKARDLGLRINDSGYVSLLPLKAGFVGSDTIACILATGMHRSKIPTLLLDLGTNGEIVFGGREGLICCSTAAGPAFEGGHIRWGMRASSGAIERVTINPDTLDLTFSAIDNHRPRGLCGSGIISAIAEMIKAGIVLEKGNFNEEIRSPRTRKGDDGWEFVIAYAAESAVDKDIVITQSDIAELQLAKSAIFAGAASLVEMLENLRIERIMLAGACGNYIDPADARVIDLFPGCRTTKKVFGVGNAAGHGACLALLDINKRKEATRIAQKLQYLELAVSKNFQELYISSMLFTAARDHEESF